MTNGDRDTSSACLGENHSITEPEDNSVISHRLHLHEAPGMALGEQARLACSILLALVEELCT